MMCILNQDLPFSFLDSRSDLDRFLATTTHCWICFVVRDDRDRDRDGDGGQEDEDEEGGGLTPPPRSRDDQKDLSEVICRSALLQHETERIVSAGST
mmetsp:Transcript_25633/g.32305  ORF Transcript_25633/g.32305 Transcript_25633/m.32305 type:complete len:97 (+) Transcript_25633:61-351(+)